MASSDKKLIVVLGATGAQGGSVINSILNDPSASAEFSLRAITRDPSKPDGQKLAARGVEVVAGDLSDKDSLAEAFRDAYGVFGVTNFWATMSAGIEIQQGKNIADAAKEAGVQHLVFSTLMNITKISGGKITGVTHFDSKATVTEYIRSLGIPASFFMAGFYMSNIPGQLQTNDSGDITWMLPISPRGSIPVFDAQTDTGKYVLAIFRRGMTSNDVFDKEYPSGTRYMSPEEIIEIIGEVKGVKAEFVKIPYEGFKKALLDKGFPEHAAEDFGQNMMLLDEGAVGYYGKAEIESVWRELGLRPTEFREWAEKNLK